MGSQMTVTNTRGRDIDEYLIPKNMSYKEDLQSHFDTKYIPASPVLGVFSRSTIPANILELLRGKQPNRRKSTIDANVVNGQKRPQEPSEEEDTQMVSTALCSFAGFILPAFSPV